jgi:hypothetical protein
MAVKGNGVSRKKPDELAPRKDDVCPSIYRFEEQPEATQNSFDVRRLVGSHWRCLPRHIWFLNEKPRYGGSGEEYGRDDEGVIIAKARDECKSSAKGASGPGHLIEDVHKGVHPAKLLDVSADDVSRDDAADKLNHAVHHSTHAVDRDHAVSVVVSIVAVIVLWMGFPVLYRHKVSACRCVNNEQ